MTGLAKKQFKEQLGKGLFQNNESCPWPELKEALDLKIFSYFDLALAEKLLGKKTSQNQRHAAFICHLSLAVREGHLCVFKEKGRLLPQPEKLWTINLLDPLSTTLTSLMKQLQEEDLCLPKQLLTDCSFESVVSNTPLCVFEGRYYFQKYWTFEYSLKTAIDQRLKMIPTPIIDTHKVQLHTEKLLFENIVNKEQAEAIINASKSSFFILHGGPGTGKTYTIGHLIHALWHVMSEEEREDYEIVLAAPTGKATSHLQKSLENQKSKLLLKTSTLHSLLGLSAFNNKSTIKKLTADLIVVDESSMIDIELFYSLMGSIKAGARLILLGDPDQLPPVEAGSLFKDLIFYLKKNNPHSQSQLKTCLRAERKELLLFSEKVKQGNAKDLICYLKQLKNQDAIQIFHPSIEKTSEDLLDETLERLEKEWDPKALQEDLISPEICASLLERYQKIRLLSPLNLGPFGVQEINRRMHARLSKKMTFGKEYAIPIMITSNDHQLNVFNGEMALLIARKRHGEKFEMEDTALFMEKTLESYRKIPVLLLPKFEYAYCLSIHKSQGSEFDHVILFLPEGSERFGRELLYTGITRAKRKLELFCSLETLEKTIITCSERISGYSEISQYE